jgi:DNA-binding transcriptional ArsR family regulator
MVDLGFIPLQKTTIRFSLEPAYNAMCSLILISDDVAGAGEWVEQTIARLPQEQSEMNERLAGLASVHLSGATWPSFLAWVDYLAAADPYVLCDQELNHLLQSAAEWLDEKELPSRDQLLADRDLFMAFCAKLMQHKGEDPHPEWCEANYALLQDPPARQAQMVQHLRLMWDEYLAPEWEQNLPLLNESLAAFESLDLSGLTTAEAFHRITGRDVPSEWRNWLDSTAQIIFIPSPHIGPYLLLIDQTNTTARVVFGARFPEGAAVQSSALSRSDLAMRLEALADDTRLRILELIALEGEQGAKDIMDRLDLSKSAASRHLRQLTAYSYLIVRQEDVSKYYSLNPTRFEDTWEALNAFLRLPTYGS